MVRLGWLRLAFPRSPANGAGTYNIPYVGPWTALLDRGARNFGRAPATVRGPDFRSLGGVDAVLIGAGSRGRDVYGAYARANPGELRFVAVAEPDDARRGVFAAAHGIPAERCFRSGEELCAAGELAPLAVVATSDTDHAGPALAAFAAGYHVLLEKPLAASWPDCRAIVDAAARANRMLQLGHVFRYTGFYARAAEILASGELGELMTVEMAEHVTYWHMAHSFVRGTWRRRADAAPMLVAKCCHDLDLLAWFVGRPAREVASFGTLSHFRPDRAPAGSGERCVACAIAPTCPFDAVAFYVHDRRGWPWSTIALEQTAASRRAAVETGRYGRCVWRCDNDVVDHQVAAFHFDGDVTATFTMHGFAPRGGRTLRLVGTEGELAGAFETGTLTVQRLRQPAREERDLNTGGGHGGGDFALIGAFLDALRRDDAVGVLASGAASLASHAMGFAAEAARQTGQVTDIAAFAAGRT